MTHENIEAKAGKNRFSENIQDFIENREIAESDFEIIEKLLRIPKNELIEFHNFFETNSTKDIMMRRLENLLAGNLSAAKKEHLTLMKDILQRYDLYVAYNLQRVLERE